MQNKRNVDPYVLSYIDTDSNFIIYLSEKLKTIKLLEQNIEKNLCDFG